ncbi:hypothetical protein R6Q59_007755 [Mikania micrantha]
METTQLPTISIALSCGEIEDDVLFLTGSKPSRRSKKRPRAVQKQLDNLFPGLWLDSISVDSYKVLETASKKFEGSCSESCFKNEKLNEIIKEILKEKEEEKEILNGVIAKLEAEKEKHKAEKDAMSNRMSKN